MGTPKNSDPYYSLIKDKIINNHAAWEVNILVHFLNIFFKTTTQKIKIRGFHNDANLQQ